MTNKTALAALTFAVTFGLAPAASADVTPQATARVTWQQQPNGHYCGPASIRMVISSRTTSLPTQAAIAQYVGTRPDTGTNRYQAGGLRPPGYAALTNVDHWIVVSRATTPRAARTT